MQFTAAEADKAARYLAAMIPPGQQNGVMRLTQEDSAFAATVARYARLPVVLPDRDDMIPDKAIFVGLISISGRTIRLARKRWGNRAAYVWVRRDSAAAVPDLTAKVLIDDKERVIFPP